MKRRSARKIARDCNFDVLHCSPRGIPPLGVENWALALVNYARASKNLGGPSGPKFGRAPEVGNGPNTVSESTASNTEFREFFGPHRVQGENSVSSVQPVQPIICVPMRTHRVLRVWRRPPTLSGDCPETSSS